MNQTIAEELIRLSATSKAPTWNRRDPSEDMKKHFGTSIRSFVEQPRTAQPGTAVGQEVLAEDYGNEDQLREDHINFIVLSAHHAAELAQFWITMHGTIDGVILPVVEEVKTQCRKLNGTCNMDPNRGTIQK